MSVEPVAPKLDENANALLVAEFQYITQTALGSNEDRARVSNYYFVAAGTAVAAIVGARFETNPPKEVYLGFSVVFTVLTLLGFFTLFSLIRLRDGWMSSARAMNRIKAFYQKVYPEAHLDEAFEWRTDSLPSPGKVNSVAFWTAAAAILVDSTTAMGALLYYDIYNSVSSAPAPLQSLPPVNTPAVVFVGLVVLAIQLFIYFRLLPLGKTKNDTRASS